MGQGSRSRCRSLLPYLLCIGIRRLLLLSHREEEEEEEEKFKGIHFRTDRRDSRGGFRV